MYENIIIIPYRNREQHLRYFIENTVPLFEKHLPNSKVVVVEQNEGKTFNRGKLLNVGFKEYENKTKYFITQDVDINPSENIVKNVYTNINHPIYRIYSAHNSSLGGIVKLSYDTVISVNGFPSNIWGWGIEDRALYYKCLITQIPIFNNDNRDFKILSHKSNAKCYTGKKLEQSNKWSKSQINKLSQEDKLKLINESGLNNLEYTVLERKNIHNIVELIKVDI